MNRLVALLGITLAAACGLSAQTAPAPKLTFPQSSPPATLKQQVGITDIEISYSRPGMKGRKIFGGLVPYGQVWRTGANTATKITFSTPVKIGGRAVPAGTYELFTIPNQNEWTVIIHKNMSQWGSYAYDAKNDVARATAKVTALPAPIETFSITFFDVRDTSASLTLSWENTRASLPIEIDTIGLLAPQIEAAMKNPATAKEIYFPSAMFYYENNHDLKKALEWMNGAIAANPGQLWMIYRKGLICEKLGDKAGARAAAQESLALAEKEKPGELREEYIRLNQALIARVR